MKNTNQLKIFTLSGNPTDDVYLSADDMPLIHWDMLMSCYHSGSCDAECEDASRHFDIEDYFEARDYLVGCGIEWEKFHPDATDEDDGDLDSEAVLMYYLWILAGDIHDMESQTKGA